MEANCRDWTAVKDKLLTFVFLDSHTFTFLKQAYANYNQSFIV